MRNGTRIWDWTFFDPTFYPITRCMVKYPEQRSGDIGLPTTLPGYISHNHAYPMHGNISLDAFDNPEPVVLTQYTSNHAEQASPHLVSPHGVSPSASPSATPTPSVSIPVTVDGYQAQQEGTASEGVQAANKNQYVNSLYYTSTNNTSTNNTSKFYRTSETNTEEGQRFFYHFFQYLSSKFGFREGVAAGSVPLLMALCAFCLWSSRASSKRMPYIVWKLKTDSTDCCSSYDDWMRLSL